MRDGNTEIDPFVDGEPAPIRWVLGVALASIVVGGTIDIVLDSPERWLSFHVIFELLMIAGALTMATSLWLGWLHARRDVLRLQHALQQQQAERDVWRDSARDALEGLGRAMDQQFDRWALTPVEREVARLLLKGHSHKAIARTTGRSDATVRQHAAAVYQKAKLPGRAALAAYFLDV